MSERQYSFGRFALHPSRRMLLRQGSPVHLGARAFDLLVALVQRADRIVEARELIDAVWGDAAVEPANLQVQVCMLRRVLGARVIATVPRKGYGFTAPVSVSRLSPRNTRVGRGQGLRMSHPLFEPGLVTLIGTSAAQRRQVASRLSRDCAEATQLAAWWFSLPPIGDADSFMAHVSRCAGPVSSSSALIVIDDCDRCTRWAREIVRLVLAANPTWRVLALASTPLRVDGERIERCGVDRYDTAVSGVRRHPLRSASSARWVG